MTGSRAFPRATSILRSVMVAGAGTALWMVLSATAASADSGTSGKHSLTDGLTATISSTVSSGPAISIPVPNVPLPAPVKALVAKEAATNGAVHVPVPAVAPIVHQVSNSVDHLAGSAPAVGSVVPAGTVGGVVNTVVVPAAGAIDHTVQVVVPPVNQAVEPVQLTPVTDGVNPVVDPVVGAIGAVLPPVGSLTPPAAILPVTVPPMTATPPTTTDPGSLLPALPDAVKATGDGVESSAAIAVTEAAAGRGATARTSGFGKVATSQAGSNFAAAGITTVLDAEWAQPTPADPSNFPVGPGTVPVGATGAGFSSSQNGPPGPAAAFLHGALIIPADLLTGPNAASYQESPAPVFSDPGSSPD
ncbi:hypothetical protein SB659_14660 [Arthrobacter sp. SIMBA_036]|uniref:hypothetical protein n=1 Tax=Arthrobacter sp. SIMBA_036 TaxID=3085778 RepID=UPI00397E7FC0